MSLESTGRLSNEERAIAPERPQPASQEIRQARAHYDLMLLTTRRAAWELESALSQGVSRERAAAMRRLANSFVWANCALDRAARELCRIDDLADDGRDEGIIWEVLL